jgi:hypothetical protein
MRKSIYILALFVFFGIFSAFRLIDEDWKTYPFARGSFKIAFPVKPEVQADTEAMLAKAESEEVIYQAMVLLGKNYDLQKANTLLEESIRGFVNPKTDKVEKKTFLKVEAYTAVEVYVSTQDGSYMVYRAVLTADKMYQLVVAGAQANKATVNVKSAKFLGSFALLTK